MYAKSYTPIDREELLQQLDTELPKNEDREQGYALVNVLPPESFAEQHIPYSINIPADNIEAFERRFSKDKKIIVYCASSDCEASEKAAEQLSEHGFKCVYDYANGLRDWERSGNPINGTKRSVGEIT